MLKSIAFITISDGIIKALGFLIIPVYLLWMPKNEYGEFGYILNTLSMLPAVLTLGLYVPQIKESSASEDKNHIRLVFSTTFITVALALTSLLVFVTLSEFYLSILSSLFLIQKNIKFKWLALSFLILFFTLNLLLYSHALHYRQPKIIIKYNGIRFLFVNIFSLLLLYAGLGYSDTVLDRLIGLAIAEILFFFTTFYWLARYYWVWQIDIAYLKSALRNGLPIIPGSFAVLVSSTSDRFFLGIHFDAGYIAEYNLAQQILVPFQMIVSGAQAVWAPYIFFEKDDVSAKSKSRKFFLKLLMLFLLVVPMLMFLVYMGQHYNLIPPSYKDTFLLIPSLSVGAIGMVLLNIPFNLFIRSNMTSWIAYISILGAVFTVIGCALIIPKYGYFGCALVSGIVNVMILAVAWHLVTKFNAKN